MKHLGLSILLTLGAASAYAQVGLGVPMSMTFSGQGDAQGNSWGTLTIRLRLPIQPALLGAPFSGQESRKSEQLLPDGTRISRPSSMLQKLARDSQGRTRVERPLAGSQTAFPTRPEQKPLMMVEINDPVEGYFYILDPAKKIAHRVKYSPVPPQTVQPRPVVSGPVAAGPLQVTTELLGSKYIQGVQAEGRRQTTVTPVGFNGNDRPITQISEMWMAPSLQLTILSTSKSPTGDSFFEMVNLSPLNPPVELFQPPVDYEIRDQPESFTVEFGVRGTGPNTSVFTGSSGTFTPPPPPGTQR